MSPKQSRIHSVGCRYREGGFAPLVSIICGVKTFMLQGLLFFILAGSGLSAENSLWLGGDWWGNRMQDWCMRDGVIRFSGNPKQPMLVATWLPGEIRSGGDGFIASVTVDFGSGGPAADAWAGVLLGIGEGKLDPGLWHYVFGLGGKGGGFVVAIASDGSLTLRDRRIENSRNPKILATGEGSPGTNGASPYRLEIRARPTGGRFELVAESRLDGKIVSSLKVADLDADDFIGGLGLIVQPPIPNNSSFHPSFSGFQVEGGSVVRSPERRFGPVAGIQFTTGAHGLKVSAQFVPTGSSAAAAPALYPKARLDFRPEGAARWTPSQVIPIRAPSHTALFDQPDWNRQSAAEIRIVPIDAQGRDAADELCYLGRVPAEPAGSELRIAQFHCPRMMGIGNDELYQAVPREHPFERFTSRNLLLPNQGALDRIKAQRPDLLLFTGDQIYEGVPTMPEFEASGTPLFEDYIYKWMVFLRAFGSITRTVPAVTMPDDHDVFLGNFWGWSGNPPPGKPGKPGYKKDHGWPFAPAFYNLVVETQSGHLPVPLGAPATPQGLNSYGTVMDFGGTSFAIVEGRSHKSPPLKKFRDHPENASLLGADQEAWLKTWPERLKDDTPRFVITQTYFVNAMTDSEGNVYADATDSDGWPKPARDRAVKLFRDAGAVLLAGDIHNSVLLKLGVDGPDDGPYQFIPLAFGQFFQRWWEPANPGGGWKTGDAPYTGQFSDVLGNPFRVIACANPKISMKEALGAGFKAGGRLIIDPDLTRAGYAFVVVDRAKGTIRFEHWDRDAKAGSPPEQFPGWPVEVPIPKPKYR